MGCGGVNSKQIDLSHFHVYQVIGKGGFGKVNAIQKKGTNVLMALKRMSKEIVIKNPKNVQRVWTERNLMAQFDSPFLVGLNYAFQSRTELFFVMPFMSGGDLRYHMNQRRRPFSEETARFYAAELLLGLEHLHDLKILYVDMKPENALLDETGHVRLSDFGLSRQLKAEENYQIMGRAGTFGYLAPEVLSNKPHGFESDVWSYGVLVFEMLHGKLPWDRYGPILSSLRSQDPSVKDFAFSNDDVCSLVGSIHVSKKLSPEAIHLLKCLLQLDRTKRLGCEPGGKGWAAVRAHPWFKPVDWKKMAERQMRPPIKPKDEKNATPDAAIADAFQDEDPKPIQAEAQNQFQGWEYNVDLTGALQSGKSPPLASSAAAARAHSSHSSDLRRSHDSTGGKQADMQQTNHNSGNSPPASALPAGSQRPSDQQNQSQNLSIASSATGNGNNSNNLSSPGSPALVTIASKELTMPLHPGLNGGSSIATTVSSGSSGTGSIATPQQVTTRIASNKIAPMPLPQQSSSPGAQNGQQQQQQQRTGSPQTAFSAPTAAASASTGAGGSATAAVTIAG